jgi:hypothetical protein
VTGCRAVAPLKIIQIKELDLRESACGRLDVSRHGEVEYDEIGAAPSGRGGEVFGSNQRVPRTGGDEYQISDRKERAEL